MKSYIGLNTERQAAKILQSLFEEIPQIEVDRFEREAQLKSGARFDIVAELSYAGTPAKFVVEVKGNGQPRVVREAALQLKRLLRDQNDEAIPLVMAPYLSEQAREVCKEEGVAYADFVGNTHIVFGSIYIDRQVSDRPEPDRRSLRSLSKPKTARILRVLLRDPGYAWRVNNLADVAKVSVGLVSNVGKVLRERGWVEQSSLGLTVTDPNDLLDSWAEEYSLPKGEELRFYTHLHGEALIDRLRTLAASDARIVMASFSAAAWLAPYVRQSTTYFYADEQGLETLQQALELKPAATGGNLIIRIPDEDGVLDDHVEPADGVAVTSPVQTYLDLLQYGERGLEGAEHLRNNLLKWSR
ncbi:MAG: type IV toxin-antitoxin system AbiEi family antitoxin [Usitatibacteraceae bacterium]